MKILIPLLSKKEDNSNFLDTALKGAKEIILLLVVDADAMSGQFGFAANEIREGNELMEKVKAEIGKKRKTALDIVEWGNTLTKIEHIAKLQDVDKIVFVKQNNQFFKRLVRELKEKLEIEIESIKIKEEVEEEK